MFIDHVRIIAQAGDGGNGIVHFRREKFKPKGGPDGGDGGDGGSVILLVDNSVDNLKAFSYDPKLICKRGGHGEGNRRHGKNSADKVAKVPPGTVVYKCSAQTISQAVEMERSEEGIDLEPIVDLTEIGERFVLCQGGKGGKGNWHFRSSTNQAPEEHGLGTEAEKGIFYLELRRIAEAGLVGFPNAGKSTLISKLSHASPKIASYPFTTLNPIVGVVEFSGYRRCTLADIPGIIEGAHENRGLGHEFLRHITRCKLLLFVLDMSGSDGRNPIEDLEILRKEINLYDPDLADFPWIIIANKMDLPVAEANLRKLRQRFPKKTILPISAEKEDGLDGLRDELDKRVGYRADKV